MSDLLLQSLEAPVNENIPELRSGDSVTVHLRIVEGKRERVQLVRGTIIRVRKGGNQASFTVRRIASNGIGVERTFLTRSSRIEKLDVHRHAHVRRAQLYFLRQRSAGLYDFDTGVRLTVDQLDFVILSLGGGTQR